MTKARGFPALTFPLREDSESRASYEAALHAALAKLFPTWLCFGAPHGVSWRPLVTGAPEGVSSADRSILPGTARFAISVSFFQHSGAAVHPHG
jgi:hypothetical protein